jgi:hypothetical protein
VTTSDHPPSLVEGKRNYFCPRNPFIPKASVCTLSGKFDVCTSCRRAKRGYRTHIKHPWEAGVRSCASPSRGRKASRFLENTAHGRVSLAIVCSTILSCLELERAWAQGQATATGLSLGHDNLKLRAGPLRPAREFEDMPKFLCTATTGT